MTWSVPGNSCCAWRVRKGWRLPLPQRNMSWQLPRQLWISSMKTQSCWVASSSQAMVDARVAIRDAERLVKNLGSPSSQASIDQALATVVLAKDKLDDAREDYKPYAKKPEDNLSRAALLNKKAQAEQDIRRGRPPVEQPARFRECARPGSSPGRPGDGPSPAGSRRAGLRNVSARPRSGTELALAQERINNARSPAGGSHRRPG